MKAVIRPMREEDLPQAAAIEGLCLPSEAWSEKVYREEFAHSANRCVRTFSAAPDGADSLDGTDSLGGSAASDDADSLDSSAAPDGTDSPDGFDSPVTNSADCCREEPVREGQAGKTNSSGTADFSEKDRDWLWFWAAVDSSDETILLGTISLTRAGDDGEIGNVAVLPAFRRQGIAGALLDEALRFGEEEQGLRNFTLEVRAGNEAAIRLYESAGFCREGRRPRFYTGPIEDALILWRRN